MSKKKHIDIYETIYGVNIIVANKYVTLKDLQKSYTYHDGVILDEDLISSQACTAKCKDIKTGRYCILVKYNHDSVIKGVNKKVDLINTCSHEAVHVVMAIYAFIQEDVYPNDHNEHFAYLVGWTAEHIYETLTKK